MAELKYLKDFSLKTNLPESVLKQVYEIESDFYSKITLEDNYEKRQALYEHVYKTTAALTSPYSNDYFSVLVDAKKDILTLFKKELEEKSIIDIGSGSGAFLYAISGSNLKYKSLSGLDVKAPTLPNDEFSKKVNCLQRNAIKFEVPEQFETAMLDNVYEHIAKSDKQFFLNSVSNSIKPGGKLILIIPHKAFGPSDWTSLIDNSFSGKLASHCVHLDETTFSDTILELKKHGFIKFYSPIPFIAFTGLRNYFSNLRLPSSWFAYIENNKFILNFLKLFKYKNRSFFRMQVIIVAEKQ